MTEQTLSPSEQKKADDLAFLRRCTPCGENVLVEMDKPDDKSAGGIALVDSAKELQGKGVVLACGKAVPDDYFGGCICSCRVRFPLHAFTRFKEGCDVVFLNYKDIAVIEPE